MLLRNNVNFCSVISMQLEAIIIGVPTHNCE